MKKPQAKKRKSKETAKPDAPADAVQLHSTTDRPLTLGDFMGTEDRDRAGDRAADWPASTALDFFNLKSAEEQGLSDQTLTPVARAYTAYVEFNRGKGTKAAAAKRSDKAKSKHQAWRDFALKLWTEQAREGHQIGKLAMTRRIKATGIEGAASSELRTIGDAIKGLKARAKRAAEKESSSNFDAPPDGKT